MADAPTGEAWDDSSHFLALASARLTRLYGEVLGRLDTPLTYRQYRTLVRVAAGHSSVAVLASFANLTMPTVSESVSVLVRRGLLTRREKPDDRRLAVIELTPAGRDAAVEAQSAVDAATDDLLADLSPAGRAFFQEALAGVFERATKYFTDESDGA